MDEHAGAALREARQRRGMDVRDVASALNLPEDVVIALEKGTTVDLLLGYVRSYAVHVGLDPDAPAEEHRRPSAPPRHRATAPEAAQPHTAPPEETQPQPRPPDQTSPLTERPYAHRGPSRWPTPDRSRPAPPPLIDPDDDTDDPTAYEESRPPGRRFRHSSAPARQPRSRIVLAAVALFLLGVTATVIGLPGSGNGDEVVFRSSAPDGDLQAEQTPDPPAPAGEVDTPEPVPEPFQETPEPEPGEDSNPTAEDSNPTAEGGARPEGVTNRGTSRQADEADSPGNDKNAAEADTTVGEGLSVQVLDGAAHPGAYSEAVERLEDLGFEVLASGTASRTYDETTVFFNDGREGDAEALHDADSRFTEVLPNDLGLSADLDLHVVVGKDWAE